MTVLTKLQMTIFGLGSDEQIIRMHGLQQVKQIKVTNVLTHGEHSNNLLKSPGLLVEVRAFFYLIRNCIPGLKRKLFGSIPFS